MNDVSEMTSSLADGQTAASEISLVPPYLPEAQGVIPDESFWRKGDLRVVPYGIGWTNMAYDSMRTSTGSFTQYVQSADVEGNPGFAINVRATRLGLDLSGPQVDDLVYTGKVEVDFYGAAPIENRSGVLLRHAYGEIRTADWKLLGGQTNDVISPLNPTMLNYTVGFAAGNIGYRRAQFRGEWTHTALDNLRFIHQGALARTIVTDFAEDPRLEGHDAGWPTVMGRWAVSWGSTSAGSGREPAVIGVSGHVGEETIDFELAPTQQDKDFPSWSANLDAYLPLTDRWGLQGEFFVGQVLGTYLGGINQGINITTRHGIRSQGGWLELWFRSSPELSWHTGFGRDDPENDDLSPGRRSRNTFVFGNVLWNVMDRLELGLEVSWWDTQFVDLAPGRAARIESAARFRF